VAKPAEPPRSIISIVPEPDPALREETSAPAVPENAWGMTRDIAAAITERYPLLRNAL
jgi:hypothetical protein